MRSTATPPGASNAAGAAVCSIQQTSAPKDPVFDLSENGRKLAHATSRVCSKPTAELGSRYECTMSPAGSETKGIDRVLEMEDKENILLEARARERGGGGFLC